MAEAAEVSAAPDSGGEFTPREIVRELDRYIIAQEEAKRAVAIALRNRWRRLRVAELFRDEITPKNILMIGPTGVGKTEISRRLAKLVNAPFVKVEASKFTEVGYIGRDVESIIRDLAERAYQLVRERELEAVRVRAEEQVEERLLDILLPGSRPQEEQTGPVERVFLQDESGVNVSVEERERASAAAGTRTRLRTMLREGKLDERTVEIEVQRQPPAQLQLLGAQQGMNELEGQLRDLFQNIVPRQRERKRVQLRDARGLLLEEAQESLLDQDSMARMAVEHAEQAGIVFIDEIDKICASGRGHGPDVSREGVQRDLLPLVEGSTVTTRYGQVRTDHVLFIASGAFHGVKPSDLMPEFQGRFPIRVELESLTSEHFERILTEPDNALTGQYAALLDTEGVELEFTRDGIAELAALTAEVNTRTEDIGARRLHTMLEKLLEELSFEADSLRGTSVRVDRAFVRERLKEIVQDVDLSRFIL